MAPGDFQDRQVTPPPDDNVNYVKAAFQWQYNWITLAGAGVFALVAGTALPILLAAGLELMYLATVPHNPRFRRLVRSWQLAEEQLKNQHKLSEMLQSMSPEMQSRYVHCAQICGSIRTNFAQLSSQSQIFLQQIDSSLQGLLNGYTRLLFAAWQQQQYLKTTSPDEIKRDIASLQKSLPSDPARVQEINQKRIEILNKRLDKFQKIAENRKVVEAQCAAVEDVLMLVRDQSVTMRDPQQVSDRLDSLVHDVEQTEQTVQQVETIFSDLSSDLNGLMSMDESSSANAPSRIRTTN
jgi:archaellum component FlaC